MKSYSFTSLFLLCLLLGVTSDSQSQERGWNGLVPLHSTRADVERVLGRPTEALSLGAFSRTATETVIINYSEGRPCGIGKKYSRWRVPSDTVETIFVSLLKERSLSDLQIDERNLTKSSGGHRAQDVYYDSLREGVSIRVFMGNVMEISLRPRTVDRDLWCIPPPIEWECQRQPPRLMNVYSVMSWRRERLLLDRFYDVFKKNTSQSIYIIVYAGQSAYAGEAMDLANRARRYLLDTHKLSSDRVIAIDGGFREERKTELYLVPDNGCLPFASPTVDPRDVRIIKSRQFKY